MQNVLNAESLHEFRKAMGKIHGGLVNIKTMFLAPEISERQFAGD